MSGNDKTVFEYYSKLSLNSSKLGKIVVTLILGAARTLFGMVRFGMIRFGMVRFGMVRFGMVRFGMIWFGMVRFGIL